MLTVASHVTIGIIMDVTILYTSISANLVALICVPTLAARDGSEWKSLRLKIRVV